MLKNSSWFASVFVLLLCTTVSFRPVHARQPKIVEVPAGPAFVKLPGSSETNALSGQALQVNTLLRTTKPGRMQVMLGDGRQFRMGGDAELRLGRSTVELLKGSMIGWIKPGTPQSSPLKIRTRLATASIQGTTVLVELNDEQFEVFSWEGTVRVDTADGQRFTLTSGQQLLLDLKRQMDDVKGQLDNLEAVLGQLGANSPLVLTDEDRVEGRRPSGKNQSPQWEPPEPVSTQDAERRLQKSLLINGFSTPLETLPEIERELGAYEPVL